MRPLVSVLLPTYQHAAFITHCLNGILAQRTTFSVEVLVGEDGSTDGTRAICERMAAEHPDRIRLFLRDRKDVIHIMGHPTGRSNMLKLLASATGKYIAVCEGDDVWTDPDKLARQVALMEGDPSCGGCYHATRIINEDGTDTGRLMREEMTGTVGLCDLYAPLVPFHTSSFMFRNAPLFAAMPKWALRVGALDLALFALAAGMGPLRRVDGVMSSYRKHAGGTTGASLHLGAPVNYLRGLLWLHVNEHFEGRCSTDSERMVLFHWRKVLDLAPTPERLRYLMGWLREAPFWFLRRPRFTAARIRDVLVVPAPPATAR